MIDSKKYFIWVFAVFCFGSCEAENTSKSKGRSFESTGELKIFPHTYWLTDLFSTSQIAYSSDCPWFLIGISLIPRGQDVNIDPYEFVFYFSAASVELHQTQMIPLSHFEGCQPDEGPQLIYVRKYNSMDSIDPIFYPEEDPGIILQGPEGELTLTTYGLGPPNQGVWEGGWVDYRIDFDLTFVDPSGNPVVVQGYNQSKLYILDRSFRESLEGHPFNHEVHE